MGHEMEWSEREGGKGREGEDVMCDFGTVLRILRDAELGLAMGMGMEMEMEH